MKESDPRNEPLVHADSDADILSTWEVMALLRPHLRREDYLATVRRMMEQDRYRLAVIVESGVVRAVAGYRIVETLYGGLTLFVDDLVVEGEARSAGYGGRLLRALKGHAWRMNCKQIHLDSGVQRSQAHRFYFREGFSIIGFHFVADAQEHPPWVH